MLFPISHDGDGLTDGEFELYWSFAHHLWVDAVLYAELVHGLVAAGRPPTNPDDVHPERPRQARDL